MRNRNQSESASSKSLGYIILIAIVAVKVLKSVLNLVVKTYDGLAESRAHRA